MDESGPVDVIILSWNRVEDTMAAITSALDQEGVDQRVLVVDQGSEAENLRRLREFLVPLPQVRLQALDCNIGVAGGRNMATAIGSAPYVVALDSDAVFAHREVLARVVQHLRAHEDIGALAFRITNYFTHRNDATSWDHPSACRPDRAFACSRFVGAGHALRRRVFEEVGRYDDRLFFCGEEIDLCYRILNRGYRIEYFPDAEILHKISPEHRVRWERGRYYFTVRNNLYTSYKIGVPIPRLLLAAAAFVVKGAANGVAADAMRGIRGAASMGLCFERGAAGNASYRLSAETWRRIIELEPWRGDSLPRKISRQFRRLPHQA